MAIGVLGWSKTGPKTSFNATVIATGGGCDGGVGAAELLPPPPQAATVVTSNMLHTFAENLFTIK